MKSLVLALIFFGVLVYGCFDVKPFKAVRKLVRRPSVRPGGEHAEQTGPLAPDPEPRHERPLSRRYR